MDYVDVALAHVVHPTIGGPELHCPVPVNSRFYIYVWRQKLAISSRKQAFTGANVGECDVSQVGKAEVVKGTLWPERIAGRNDLRANLTTDDDERLRGVWGTKANAPDNEHGKSCAWECSEIRLKESWMRTLLKRWAKVWKVYIVSR